MATLSFQFLKALGIDEEKAEAIGERHKEVLAEIKAERDELKEKAEGYDDIKRQFDELKKATANAEKDPYKVKYEAIKEEFEAFKNDLSAKETASKKDGAYRKLLKDAGVSEKRIDAIMKVTDLKDYELDDEGKFKEASKYTEAIKSEWADFIQTTETKGADTSKPPKGNGKPSMTKEQIRAIEDPIARQKAMAENPSLFGLPDNSDE